QPGGSPPYRFAADVERNPNFTPSAPNTRRRPASADEDEGRRADGSNTGSSDEHNNDRDTAATMRRPRRPVPQTHARLHDGFQLYRQLGNVVFMLQKQQRQDNSPS
ncbi:hypothetical protein Vretimale_17452, partial [Volvox reticuliferus]